MQRIPLKSPKLIFLLAITAHLVWEKVAVSLGWKARNGFCWVWELLQEEFG